MHAALASLTLLLATAQTSPDAGYVRSRVTTENNPRRPCLFWNQPEVAWAQSAQGYAGLDDGTEFTAISRSFGTWDDALAACGNMRFTERARSASRKVGFAPSGANENLVLFRDRTCATVVPSSDACYDDDSCANAFDCWDDSNVTIAVTLTTYDVASGVIYDSDIVANATRDEAFTTTDTALLRRTDIQNTMTHEVGHLLGLDHVNDRASTMYAEAATGEVSKRSLDPASAAFVCAVYPRGRPSQSCVPPSPLPANLGAKGGGGCAAGAGPLVPVGGLLAWALLQRVLGARRRRREGRA